MIMNHASRTIFYFGYYEVVLGLVLILMPNLALGIFGQPETKEVWLRIVGVLVLNKGIYYIFAAPDNPIKFSKATVLSRLLVVFWFIVFVSAGWATWELLIFAGIDLLGSLWTIYGLRKDRAAIS